MKRLLFAIGCALALGACTSGPPARGGGPYKGDTPWNISSTTTATRAG